MLLAHTWREKIISKKEWGYKVVMGVLLIAMFCVLPRYRYNTSSKVLLVGGGKDHSAGSLPGAYRALKNNGGKADVFWSDDDTHFIFVYLICFLHQTTTLWWTKRLFRLLYLICFLHQTTTFCDRFNYFNRCILFVFYIKPQLNS